MRSTWCAAQVALAFGSRTNLPTLAWVRGADHGRLSVPLRAAIGRISR